MLAAPDSLRCDLRVESHPAGMNTGFYSAKGDKGLLPLLGRMWSWSRVPCFSGAAGALCDDIFVNDDDSGIIIVTKFSESANVSGPFHPVLP
jgi:hypothetical protein